MVAGLVMLAAHPAAAQSCSAPQNCNDGTRPGTVLNWNGSGWECIANPAVPSGTMCGRYNGSQLALGFNNSLLVGYRAGGIPDTDFVQCMGLNSICGDFSTGLSDNRCAANGYSNCPSGYRIAMLDSYVTDSFSMSYAQYVTCVKI